MAYTETIYRSWFTRFKGSIGGIFTEIILIVLGTWLLWWNEGNTFKTAGAIGEAEKLTQEVKDISKINPDLDGKLIHALGFANTDDIVKDDIFGVEFKAIKLTRKVEYYQWTEHSQSETHKKLGGGEETVTTYTYEAEWTDEPIDSDSFSDSAYRGKNFVIAAIEDNDFIAEKVSFGAYVLPDFLKRSMGGAVPVKIGEINKKSIEKNIHVKSNNIHVSGSTIYLGTPSKPKIGDVRISFSQTPPAEISIIAQVIRDTFEPFTASNGYEFSRLEMGKVGFAKMFADAKSENKIMAWILRLIGSVIIMVALDMIFTPLSIIFDIIPFLGSIVEVGAGIFAIIIGLAWSLIVIAIAWLRFRPIIAICLIVVAFGLVFLLKSKKSFQNK